MADHLESFSNLLGDGIWVRRLGGLWACVAWVVWRWHNAVIFEGKEWDSKKVEEEIKCRFWSWCLAKGDMVASNNYLVWASKKLYENWLAN